MKNTDCTPVTNVVTFHHLHGTVVADVQRSSITILNKTHNLLIIIFLN